MRIQERTPRPVASLQLAYNQCIIQTTRPVLLHLFKMQFSLGSRVREEGDQTPPPKQTVSSITRALAESCVNAALASSRIVEGLFLNGSIALYGYWDAHHIFSAAMILIMSAVMKPTALNSDPLETLLSVLRSMKNDGNIPAVDFCERLSQLQSQILNLRATGRLDPTGSDTSLVAVSTTEGSSDAGQQPDTTINHVPSYPITVGTPISGGGGVGAQIMPYESLDILSNPLIGSFLDGNQVQWLDAAVFPEDGTLREFASEIEEPFMFVN